MSILKTLVVTIIAGLAFAGVASASSICQTNAVNNHSVTHQMTNLVKMNKQSIDAQMK